MTRTSGQTAYSVASLAQELGVSDPCATATTAVSCGRRQTRCSIAGWSSTTTCAVTTAPTLTPVGACSAGRRERDAGDEPGDHQVHD
jgi:hypothetical protein